MSGNWAPSEADLVKFVYAEAEMLDQRRFEDWFGLFAEDGRYWLPLHPEQTDGVREQSILHEDRLLLRARIERLLSGKAYSDRPPIRSQHVMQAPCVVENEPESNRYRTRTAFLYAEQRREQQMILSGTAAHTLRVEGGTLRIVEKRVDLLNAGTAMPAIFLMP